MTENIKQPAPASEKTNPEAVNDRRFTKEPTDDEKIDAAAARILTEYRRAFEELAK